MNRINLTPFYIISLVLGAIGIGYSIAFHEWFSVFCFSVCAVICLIILYIKDSN